MRTMEQIVNNFIGNSYDEDLHMGSYGEEADYIEWLIANELGEDYTEEELNDLYETKYLNGYRLDEYKNA